MLIEKGQRVALAIDARPQPRGTLVHCDPNDFVCSILWDSGDYTHTDTDFLRWLTPLELLAEQAE